MKLTIEMILNSNTNRKTQTGKVQAESSHISSKIKPGQQVSCGFSQSDTVETKNDNGGWETFMDVDEVFITDVAEGEVGQSQFHQQMIDNFGDDRNDENKKKPILQKYSGSFDKENKMKETLK